MPNYLIDYFCFIACLINVKLCASLPLSFVALSFSALEHMRKYPASFIKRQEHTQTLNGKDRAFYVIILLFFLILTIYLTFHFEH